MKERGKKGLCYHSNEKWKSGHHCKRAKIFLLEGVPFFHELPSSGPQLMELDANRSVIFPEGQDFLQDTPKITLYELVGNPFPSTMRIKGRI